MLIRLAVYWNCLPLVTPMQNSAPNPLMYWPERNGKLMLCSLVVFVMHAPFSIVCCMLKIVKTFYTALRFAILVKLHVENRDKHL